ncbi:MAG: CvpA family protein [Planctomycetota bacterium]
MSLYDILMIVVFVGAILFGLWKGLAWQVASLAAIFVSYFVALNFSGALSEYISEIAPWNRFAAMLILYIGTSLIVWMGYGYLKSTIARLQLRGFDTQAGGLLGGLKGLALCMVITLFSVTLFGDKVSDDVIESRTGSYLAAGINRLNLIVPDEFHAVLDKHVQKFNNNLAEKDPKFIEESTEKLEEKLQTIRGHFKLPKASDGTLENKASPAGTQVTSGSQDGSHILMPHRENSNGNSGFGGSGTGSFDTASEIPASGQLNR